MNKEENYRNLAGNITAFTDNTMFYEDWLVIQQYVDDWLDEIDKLQQENEKYKEVIYELKMRISARIKKYQQKIDNEIDMGSQGDYFKICRYEENINFLKDILKEVK